MFANEIWPLDIANIAPTIAGKALSRKRLVGTTSHLHNLKVNRNKTVPTFKSRLLIVPCGDLVEEYANFKIRLGDYVAIYNLSVIFLDIRLTVDSISQKE